MTKMSCVQSGAKAGAEAGVEAKAGGKAQSGVEAGAGDGPQAGTVATIIKSKISFFIDPDSDFILSKSNKKLQTGGKSTT